jgi:multidrug efflux pump subunit AcrA (membrane-fusion protein)
VISRNVDVGQTVAASMSAPTLFVLAADLTKMQVLASLDESDVGRIRPGQAVRFRVDAFPTDEFTGNVTQVRLQPTTVQNVVTYQTVIDVPNPGLKLKPGMTANVNIEIARRTDVIRVPNTALRFRPTAEIFAALGQTPPPAAVGGRGAGARPDTRNQEPAPAPAAQPAPAQPPVIARRPATERPASAQTAGQGESSAPQTRRGEGGERRSGRGNLTERMANMTPEEREQFLERMRARGLTPPAGDQASDAPASGGRGQGPRAQGQTQAARTAAPTAAQGATTFDALFGPLTQPVTFGQAWLNVGNKLQRVRLRLGISDGQQTEVIQALDGELKDGTEVVTNVIIGAVRQAVTPAGGAAFPGLSGGRQGFGRGGRGGG